MRRRQTLPRLWLFTDPRGGDPVAVARRLPRGSGIVFRHYDLPRAERRELFEQVRRLARARRHLVLLADRPVIARAWGADGAHHRSIGRSLGLRSVAVHDLRELALARRVAADLIFVSPVYPTRSHPGARTLGARRACAMARQFAGAPIALGGVNARLFKELRRSFDGWAAIDAFRT